MQPSTTSTQESFSVFANGLKLNANSSKHPYIKGIQEPSSTFAES